MNDRSREADRAAQETEASFVLLAAWFVLAVLGVCLILTDISILGGIIMLAPLPLLLMKRYFDKKKRSKLRQEQVKSYLDGKNHD